MKKLILTAALLAMTLSVARAGVQIGISVGFPLPGVAVVAAPGPVRLAAPPVCVSHAPVVVYRPPVVVAPPPVVCGRPPVYAGGYYAGCGPRWHYRAHRGWHGRR